MPQRDVNRWNVAGAQQETVQSSVSAFQAVPGGFLITDLQGAIQEVDHAAAVLLMISERRLLGKPLGSFILPEQLAEFSHLLEQASKSDQILEWTATLQVKEQKTLDVYLAVIAFYDEQGQRAGLRWLLRKAIQPAPGVQQVPPDGDSMRISNTLKKVQQELEQRVKELLNANAQLAQEIESRKRAEDALRKARQELEGRVKARTAELAIANERLQAELAERKRVEGSAAQRARELDALHTATATLHSTLELEPLLGQILDAATSAIPAAEKGLLHLVAPDTGQLEMRATIGYKDQRIRKFSSPGSKGYVVKAVRERRPLISHDVQTDPLVRYNGQIPEALAIRSAIVAPLLQSDDVLGAISLESPKKSAFTDNDLYLLVSFASTATAAIHNAQLHAEVQKLAVTDALTGVYNRRGFVQLGKREIERTRRFNRPLSVLMVDIDYFKSVNDSFGHHAGDLVLVEVAQRLGRNIREVDVLARYGGEEFTLLLPETDLFLASGVAERLRSSVADQPFFIEGATLQVSVSVGVAKFSPETADLTTLVMQADNAMYVAKQTGRNRVVVG